jgi:riboflavin biosynthesis pyrimidine reductase
MDHPRGPGMPFQVLLDADMTDGRSLPAPVQASYGSDWRLPIPAAERPYTYVNFVTSHDGRVSFDEPGHMGGGDISRFNRHDQWLMGLLRARADAILVGDTTLKVEPDHIWTAEAIFPDDAQTWQALRHAEERAPIPLHVFLSMDGELPPDAAVFARADIPILVATTQAGARTAHDRLQGVPNAEVVAFGTESVDLRHLVTELRTGRGISSLLCEGGAHVYGAMLAAGLIDDEFLTISPIIVGNRPRGEGRPRPSLVEGVAFSPERPPMSRLLSVRRSESYLFLSSRLLHDG